MTQKNNYCVIMAGGIGSRFWPMSRSSRPKQFIDVLGTGETLLQQTFRRFSSIVPKKNILIVTSDVYGSLVHEQIPGLEEHQVLLEPARRNTAPCIAYACYKIQQLNPAANMVIAPSDHIIIKEDVFCDIVSSALEATAKNPWLITLGITPSFPNTGYGYIQFKETDAYPHDKRLNKVKTFTEKPELEMARSFMESGDFLWNSGIFIWSLKSILGAFKKYAPDIDQTFSKGRALYNTSNEKQFIQESYTTCKSISIDYAVMEKADNVFVMKSDFGWSDLGTWGSLYEHREKNSQGNAIVGKNAMLYDCNNCIIHLPKEKLAVLQGLSDYIIVESDNILLVCRKSDEQEIRQFVNDVMVEKGEQFV
jgi:mannose-1-phosphate guanylyltransferase